MLARRIAVAVAAAILLASAPSPAHAALSPCAWPQYGHDPGHSFAQPAGCTVMGPIRSTTLKPAWFVPAADSVTASAAVVDGVAYVGSWDGVMRAIDTRTGKLRWTFKVTDTSNVAFGYIESSAAVTDIGGTRVVLFGGGATLYALDARTGRQLTSVCVDPRADPAVRCKGDSRGQIEIESSPSIVRINNETRILVGFDLHNEPKVGRSGMLLFRVRPGPSWRLEPIWKFDPETRHTYTGSDLLTRDAGKGDGCAGVWSSPAVDVPGDMVFFGTSSCSYDGISSGESLWGIKLSTGAFVWTFEPHAPPFPSRRWDDDFGASPNLLPYGLVGDGGKDGWYYALDRKTGHPRWKTHAGESGHVTVDFAIGGMIGSAAVGSVKGEPAIFATTAISTPLRTPIDDGIPGDLDPTLAEDPGRLFSVHAIRARDGKILWRSPLSRQSYGAATYANGVVLVPSTFDVSIKALDAGTGLPLSSWPVIGAPSSAPVPVDNMVVVGSGTRTTDLEYKAFGASALETILGASPLSPLSGVWGFRLTLPPG